MRAKEIMTDTVLTAHAEWSVDQLANFLVDNAISGAPVVEKNGILLGAVSLTDIARHLGFQVPSKTYALQQTSEDVELSEWFLNDEARFMQVEGNSEALVKDIMTPVLFEINEDAYVSEVAEMMIKGRIHRLFVTKNKKVIGVITGHDLIRLIAEQKQFSEGVQSH